MGIFDKLNEPVFFKDDSNAKKQLEELKKLSTQCVGELKEQIEQEIKILDAGIYGEDTIKFELQNSHIPMYVLHDLFLEHNGLTAQIDYLIITRKLIFVVECKNLYGNIEINNNGDFIRSFSYGKYTKKEGIYSPITQNKRHLDLMKAIRMDEMNNFIVRKAFEKFFPLSFRSIVVLSNPKTILNAKYAKKEVKEKVIRADQLIEYIKKANAESGFDSSSDKDLEATATYWLSLHKEQKTDYLEKYRSAIETYPPENIKAANTEKKASEPRDTEKVLCPKCGSEMVKRKATRGTNAGSEFYGCSRFPQCRGIINIK